MCTAVVWNGMFGRNLDLELTYGETVTVTPRNMPLVFRQMPHLQRHYAILGMAHVADGVPLYYDALNEKGLCMAGLNFPDQAVYDAYAEGKDNVTPFELLPWLLGQCTSVDEAERLLHRINLLKEPFSPQLPLTPLHWMLADQKRCIVVEPMVDGISIMENEIGVLTNSPPFFWHMTNLANYQHVTAQPSGRQFCGLPLKPYSRGMGAMGLPGDHSSSSRFVKAAFTRLNAVTGRSEEENLSQFFHILHCVEQQRGCVELEPGVFELTQYSSCCNMEKGIYCYTTYNNSQITAVALHRENLEGTKPVYYPVLQHLNMKIQNE